MRSLESFITPNLKHRRLEPRDFYPPSTICHEPHMNHRSILYSSTDVDVDIATAASTSGVLSNEDIFIGTILAFVLAFLFSFLQGRTPSSSNIVLWRDDDDEKDKMDSLANYRSNASDGNADIGTDDEVLSEKIFDGDMWKEMSRPENYATYSRDKSQSIRATKPEKSDVTMNQGKTGDTKENKLVLIALLVLFVPIFSVEFFFALSRQFICGGYVTSVDDAMWIMDAKKAAAASNGSSPWATQLCSPANMLR
jgi:hypothetical protein